MSGDMKISMDMHGKSVDEDMNMDKKFHIYGNPEKKREGRRREKIPQFTFLAMPLHG